jgi:hypothetical protein
MLNASQLKAEAFKAHIHRVVMILNFEGFLKGDGINFARN